MPTVHSFHEALVAGRGGVCAALLRPVLRLASWGYRGGVAVRNWRFDRGAAARVAAPVISVGNITTGGTGKTPLVIELLARLARTGRKPAVVSRGYKSLPQGTADELLLIERSVPGTVCIADPDRVAGARLALAGGEVDTIVLDDGFQHRRLARDLDIVLVDATDPFGGGYLLPRGRLREPIGGLRRADLVVITRSDQVDAEQLAALEGDIDARTGGKPRITAVHRPRLLHPLHPRTDEAAESPGTPVFLLSGIARPAAFARTAQDVGLTVCGHARFADHQRYTAAQVAEACARAQDAGASAVVMTAKDAVKLAALPAAWTLPAWVLEVRIDFPGDGGTILDAALRGALERHDRHER